MALFQNLLNKKLIMHPFPIKSYWIIIVALLTSCTPHEEAPTHSNSPYQNVIILLADDHALGVTGCYGNTTIKTPNLDQLAQQSTLFHRAYCNAPICSASRASILTGKYPHATGVNLLFTPFPDEGNHTVAEHLQQHGFATGIFGKTHFNNWLWSGLYENGLPKHGFDTVVDRSVYRQWLKQNTPPDLPNGLLTYHRPSSRDQLGAWMNAGALPHPIDDAHSEGTFYTNAAIEFLQSNQDHPFLLWLAFKEPHHPYYFPIEFANQYDPAAIDLPVGSPEDDLWVPQKYQSLSDQEKQGIIAAYYTSTSYMDKNVGMLLQAVEDLGIAEQTLIIYLSDNGYLLYEHKRFEKHTLWEESVHQPLMFRLGTSPPKQQNAMAMVEYVDVVPTILDLLGMPPIAEVQGESFVHLFHTAKDEHRSNAFSTYLEDNMAMVCTKEWKYMFATGRRDLGISYQTGNGPSGIDHRLYNLTDDPNEKRNLAYLEDYQSQLKEMQTLLLERFKASHPETSRLPQQLSLEGQLVWFCEPRDIGADQSLDDHPFRVFKKQSS